MKTLALNLLKTLLLVTFGTVLASTSSSSSARRLISVANVKGVPTTTPVPPSLQAPPHLQLRRHTLPATPTTTALPTIQMASTNNNSRQRMPIARHAAKHIKATTPTSATTVMTKSNRKPIITETSTLEPTRLVQHIDATTSTISTALPLNDSSAAGVGLRQQRSFPSNGFQSYEHIDARRKYKTLERRQYTRSYSPITKAATITTTAAPIIRKQQRLRQRTTSQHSQFGDSNRLLLQPKQSSSVLQDDGLKSTRNSSTASSTPPILSSNHGKTKITTIPHNRQTTKTPRMIQRLVAGHIQNAESRSTYQVSAVTSNNTITSSTAAIKSLPTKYAPRRQSILSSSYRSAQLNAHDKVAATTPSITTAATTLQKLAESLIDSNHDIDYHDDDEALLDDSGDFDNWDNGILRLSAGSGKENNPKSKKLKEDSKKTLSDQVRDGKYGLIEKELFRHTPKRPGLLSYLPNKEVPEDNERNLGGLNEEDIWLAEDHLLVIKGGSLNEDNADEPWPAIDDYNGAGRPIKIPSNPKIPPPFPVQLEENGPLQLIGNNKLTVVYPITNESLPVYTIGSQAYNSASSDDSDDEKNLITWSGKTKNVKENQSHYNYPSPELPWLYNNQTVANPSLRGGNNDNKPINFPILGPFLYGRNGSLDNINGTEEFDEDDPSLYYPPAYSFVYKSNYTNPVPPGPLVPGIVVPPPPDQFSKLEKSFKDRRTWKSSTQSPPIRYRVYSTTTTLPTATSTTTTTTTTLEPPYRHVVTKISEYTPKTINTITPEPRPVYTPTQSVRFSHTPSPTPPPRNIETVPVPVAVPIPIYPVNVNPSVQGNIDSFVPTTPDPNVETLSKANPIYYDYIETKRQPGNDNAYGDYHSTTSKPISSPKHIKVFPTSKRPFKSQGQHRNYLQRLAPNHRYEDSNVVVITPKPEIRFKHRPIYKEKPLQSFENEVNTIQETIRYYHNQELRDNSIPRTPKAKPVYNYNYDGPKTDVGDDTRNQFQPPAEYDGEPFKPMVTYSPEVNDEHAFRALAVEKLPADNAQPQGRENFVELPKYPTTTLLPVQPHARSKKLRTGGKYLQQQQQDYLDAPQRQTSWLGANKQEYNDYVQTDRPVQSELYQEPQQQQPLALPPRNREFSGYYYGPTRQNNRFYEEPFQNIPSRKIINYRPQLQSPQQQQIWSLQNDTLVNELPNRPPINPEAEFIDPYLVGPSSNNYPYQRQQQQQQQQQQRLTYQHHHTAPPPISHQSQYYAPRPHLNQRIPSRHFQQAPQQQSPPYSLINDELVNYRQPLPPINPDSEWITHPQVLRNPQHQFYRANNYRLPQPLPSPVPIPNVPGEADVYYLTPKYRRANNFVNNNRYQQHHQHINNNSNGK